jgi:glycosyltransferase involved in cell wall biosynthesis
MKQPANHEATNFAEPLFSIVIPSWNNLPFLRLCVESIRQHSDYQHQIIVHVNDGSDGTLQWVRDEGLDYTHSDQNVGVCLAMNMMRTKVKTDYILFLNDDMYVLPHWDKALYEEIKSLPDNKFFLSSTTIQPHTASGPVVLADYGDTIETFRRDDLLRDYMTFPVEDWAGATLPPNIVHRDIWDLVGGYSVEYSPGMYSDPDFTAKLWLCGIRYMKGLGNSRIYHFETKSTTRIRKNNGRLQFLLKWGISSSSFRKYFTWRDQAYALDKIDAYDAKKLRYAIVKGRLSALKALFTKDFGPLWKFWTKTPTGAAKRYRK